MVVLDEMVPVGHEEDRSKSRLDQQTGRERNHVFIIAWFDRVKVRVRASFLVQTRYAFLTARNENVRVFCKRYRLPRRSFADAPRGAAEEGGVVNSQPGGDPGGLSPRLVDEVFIDQPQRRQARRQYLPIGQGDIVEDHFLGDVRITLAKFLDRGMLERAADNRLGVPDNVEDLDRVGCRTPDSTQSFNVAQNRGSLRPQIGRWSGHGNVTALRIDASAPHSIKVAGSPGSPPASGRSRRSACG